MFKFFAFLWCRFYRIHLTSSLPQPCYCRPLINAICFIRLLLSSPTDGWNPKVWKTSKLKKTLNPIWNEEFIVPVGSPEKDGVRFTVFDYDFIGSNDLLGQVIFPNLHKLPLGVPTEAILSLTGLHSSKGTLHVVLTAMNFGVQGPTVIQTTTTSSPAPAPVAVQTVQQTTTTAPAYNPYGAPAPGVAAPNPYGAPPSPYGAPQYGAPPPQNPYGAPPQQAYQVPNMYGAPAYPPQNSYAQPQYGAPPPQQNPYGAPAPQNPYGAPPPQYGAPPPQQNPYGAPGY